MLTGGLTVLLTEWIIVEIYMGSGTSSGANCLVNISLRLVSQILHKKQSSPCANILLHVEEPEFLSHKYKRLQ